MYLTGYGRIGKKAKSVWLRKAWEAHLLEWKKRGYTGNHVWFNIWLKRCICIIRMHLDISPVKLSTSSMWYVSSFFTMFNEVLMNSDWEPTSKSTCNNKTSQEICIAITVSLSLEVIRTSYVVYFYSKF